MRVIISLLFTTIICSCSNTYTAKGVDLNKPESYITVTTDSKHENGIYSGRDQKTFIKAVDEKTLFQPRLGGDYPEIVHILPGEHKLNVKYQFWDTFADGCIIFNAKQGENYQVKKAVFGKSVLFWLEETETKVKAGKQCNES